ncbi:MAG: hypothetical protein J6L03_08815 [Bacteroidaceae bacterium]|nr:hypothetical protein [Bacteroidaceae bacterium]
MDPISLILGGISAAGGLASGIAGLAQSNKQAQEAARMQRERDEFNRNIFNRQYYQDAISRNDTQHFLRQLRNNMRDTVKQQANTAVITGQTPEAVAATKEANARAYADAIAGIDATNSQRKDAALAGYQAGKNQSFADWMESYTQQAQNWTNFANQAFAIGAQGINTIGSAIDAKYTPATAETPATQYTPFSPKHNDINPENMA